MKTDVDFAVYAAAARQVVPERWRVCPLTASDDPVQYNRTLTVLIIRNAQIAVVVL